MRLGIDIGIAHFFHRPAGESSSRIPRVAQTVVVLRERPIANAFGIEFSITATRGSWKSTAVRSPSDTTGARANAASTSPRRTASAGSGASASRT